MVSIHLIVATALGLGLSGAAGHQSASSPPPSPKAPVGSQVLAWNFRPTTPATMQWVYRTRTGQTVILTAPFPRRALTSQDARSAWTREDAVSPLRALVQKDPAALRRLWPAGVQPSPAIRALLTVAQLNPRRWGGPNVDPLTQLSRSDRTWLTQMGFRPLAQSWHPAVPSAAAPALPSVPLADLAGALVTAGGLGIWGWRRAHVPPPML